MSPESASAESASPESASPESASPENTAPQTGEPETGEESTSEPSTAAGAGDAESSAPLIEVVSGSPNAEEVAALVAVLTAVAAAGSAETAPTSDRPRIDGWNAYWRSMRTVHRPGPGAWRTF